METLLSLTEAIELAVIDPDVTTPEIHAVINRGILEIAGGATRDFDVPTLPPLPDLAKEFEIDTVVGVTSTDMPADYQRSVHLGFDYQFETLSQYDNLLKFHKAFRSSTDNRVSAFCVRGRKVYYWGSPSSAQTMYLHGFTYPDVLALNDDTPDCLPEHLQYRLLVNYACMELYSGIEQDHKKPSYNFDKYTGLYFRALTDLFSVIDKDEEAQFIEDERF